MTAAVPEKPCYPDGELLRHVPNILTLSRLVLVPFVLRLIWLREYAWVLLWGGIAATTDAIDGTLARRLGARTRLGAYLDPLADKLLLSGSYLAFSMNGTIPWWVTVIVLGRDVLILLFAAAAFAFTSAREFPPSVWGKVSTAVQVAGALLVLLAELTGRLETLSSFALGVVAAATVWSFIHYSFVAIGILRRARGATARESQPVAH